MTALFLKEEMDSDMANLVFGENLRGETNMAVPFQHNSSATGGNGPGRDHFA